MNKLETPPRYRILDETCIADALAKHPNCKAVLGGDPSSWQAKEVGDGNLNQVYIVSGPEGSLVAKQSLPYLRLVGESWPLPLSRAYFENLALQSQAKYAPGLVPNIYAYDSDLYCIAMEYLEPHIIMRKGMIAGIQYPGFADVLSEFMARNLFFTSDLHMDTGTKRQAIAEFCGNHVLCKITEDVIFTEPYMEHPNNRWTSPQLDGYAERWRADSDLRVAINELKVKYMTQAQSLLHADLHTGSIMVTEQDTRMIDAEFAFYGPIGFDVGKLMANLLMSYFSQSGHESEAGERDSYRDWILEATTQMCEGFATKFLGLWRDKDAASGDAYPSKMFADGGLEDGQHAYMRKLWEDTLGFCGACITRRILGIAHNIDFEEIEDTALRGLCEARALELSRELLVNRDAYKSMQDVVAIARKLQAGTPDLLR